MKLLTANKYFAKYGQYKLLNLHYYYMTRVSAHIT